VGLVMIADVCQLPGTVASGPGLARLVSRLGSWSRGGAALQRDSERITLD
jgi:hypothetical protein